MYKQLKFMFIFLTKEFNFLKKSLIINLKAIQITYNWLIKPCLSDIVLFYKY